MNQGKYIFSQLKDFFCKLVFNGIVSKNNGNKYLKTFTRWNQMLCMVFGVLTSRDIIRDLLLSVEAHISICFHLRLSLTSNQKKTWAKPMKT